MASASTFHYRGADTKSVGFVVDKRNTIYFLRRSGRSRSFKLDSSLDALFNRFPFDSHSPNPNLSLGRGGGTDRLAGKKL